METSEAVRPRKFRGNLAGRVQVAGHVGERLVGVGADRRDGGDAHHDDQGEHDGVFDRGRAVFTLQEVDDALSKLTHDCYPSSESMFRRFSRTFRLWTWSATFR